MVSQIIIASLISQSLPHCLLESRKRQDRFLYYVVVVKGGTGSFHHVDRRKGTAAVIYTGGTGSFHDHVVVVIFQKK